MRADPGKTVRGLQEQWEEVVISKIWAYTEMDQHSLEAWMAEVRGVHAELQDQCPGERAGFQPISVCVCACVCGRRMVVHGCD